MKVVTIGRSSKNDIRFDDPYVGRHHCQIIQHDNGTFSIVDLNSTNGTFVNEKRIFGEAMLQSGDTVRIGHSNVPWKSYFTSVPKPPKPKSKVLPIVLGGIGVVALLVVLGVLLGRTNGIDDGEIHYNGPEPPVTVVTLEENGESYEVYAAQGQVIVMFNETVSHKDAVEILGKYKAKVVGQMPDIHYYLAEVSAGKEGEFVAQLRQLPEVLFIYPNAIEDLLSAFSYALDDINGNHGKKVVEMIEESGCSAIKYDIASNGYISLNKEFESIRSVLEKMGDNASAVINLSVGVSLTRWFGLWPWQDRVLWNEFMVTEGNRRAYLDRYVKGLKNLILFVQPYDKKDFVVIKSAGNEGMKEMEVILSELMDVLEPAQYAVFERHFLLVSAKDNNKEGDYPNDISYGHYNKMLTKVDISDKTARDLHWQGTSFSAPRATGFITAIANKYNKKVIDVLDYARKATMVHPEHLLTMDGLKKQVTNLNTSEGTTGEGTSGNPSVSYLSRERVKQDLIGTVIKDPSPQSYFPSGWSWTLKEHEITNINFNQGGAMIANDCTTIKATLFLLRRQMKVNVDVVLKYKQINDVLKYDGLTVQKIYFPSQQDYSSYVKIYMDYDFMPSLVVKNTSNMTLFVAGSYTSKGETTRFSAELEAHESKTLGIGPTPDSYNVHFAYKE